MAKKYPDKHLCMAKAPDCSQPRISGWIEQLRCCSYKLTQLVTISQTLTADAQPLGASLALTLITDLDSSESGYHLIQKA